MIAVSRLERRLGKTDVGFRCLRSANFSFVDGFGSKAFPVERTCVFVAAVTCFVYGVGLPDIIERASIMPLECQNGIIPQT